MNNFMTKNDNPAFTLILPGYSPHNRDWAYKVKGCFEKQGLKAKVYEWKHWSGGKMQLNKEVKSLVEFISDERINVVAKSIGTKVFMKLLPKIEKQINKVVLCGIPIDPIGYAKGMKVLGPSRLIVFQNSKDPFMPHAAISAFVGLVDQKLKVVKKVSNTHDYPYFAEFIDFLK